MGCLIVLLMAFSARVALVFTWIFTDLISRAFDGWIIPLAGLVFLPWTALLYALVYSPLKGVSLLGWVIVAIGFLTDVATLGDGGRRAKARQQSG